MLEKIKNRLISLLGGFTEEDFDAEFNTLRNIEKEVFSVGDKIWFFYVSRSHGGKFTKYYTATITGINSLKEEKREFLSYVLDTSKLEHFMPTIEVNPSHISHTKIGLRDRVMNSNSYRFLDYNDC